MNDKIPDILDHVVEMVGFYRSKMEDGDLNAGEAAVYLKCLSLLGAREAALNTRTVERLAAVEEVPRLPFPTER